MRSYSTDWLLVQLKSFTLVIEVVQLYFRVDVKTVHFSAYMLRKEIVQNNFIAKEGGWEGYVHQASGGDASKCANEV